MIFRIFKKLLVLIATPLAILVKLFGIRFIESISENRIGHLVLEPLYIDIKSRENRDFGRIFVTFIPNGVSANNYILESLPKKFRVINNPFFWKLLYVFRFNDFTKLDIRRDIWNPNFSSPVFKYTNISFPFFNFPAQSNRSFQALKINLGLDDSEWYVCLHNREEGYTKNLIEENSNSFRNSPINNFNSTINYIYEMGGRVIRMGNKTMTPFPESEGLIDYAHSALRSEENDALLSTNCRFFIGDTSGFKIIASAHGIPVVGVNLAPMGASKIWGMKDIGVPKLYLSGSDSKPLPFKEIFKLNLANFYHDKQFKEADIHLKESAEDEILEAVKQMLRELNSEFKQSPLEIELEAKFNSLFNTSNYSFHSDSRISSYFLLKYAELL
jgi:putative glycosyltransferase (TIGR04372 family)